MGGDKSKQLVFEDYLNMYRGLSNKNPSSAYTNQAEVMPVRSTTRTNTAPLVSLCTASLSLEEMREDFQAIGWEDQFSVQSVVTVETAAPAPAMLKLCHFAANMPEKNGKQKEIQNDRSALSMCYLPSDKTKPPLRIAAKSSKTADMYFWRKYDSRKRADHPYRQRYYKCRETGCSARKIIDRDANNSSMLIITYDGEHNHPHLK